MLGSLGSNSQHITMLMIGANFTAEAVIMNPTMTRSVLDGRADPHAGDKTIANSSSSFPVLYVLTLERPGVCCQVQAKGTSPLC
jgi:hypothetical protein